jgi:hypothetical protein
MTDEELSQILALMSKPAPVKQELEFRLYYDGDGQVVTYTTEKLEGQYIVITRDQYNEARGDVLVKDGKLCYTHKTTHIGKYTKNIQDGVRTSKYDINILCDENFVYWKYEQHEIR